MKKDVGSALFEKASLRAIVIRKEADLLMFGERPDKLIPGSKIEVVRFHDKELPV